jgi:hypothetical protein
LAGGEPGHYGLAESKELTPPIEPVPAEVDGG